MDSAKAVTVEFKQFQYWLATSVADGVGGTIAPVSGLQDVGTVVGLTATPVNEYWYVAGWSGVDWIDPADPNKATVTISSDPTAVEVTFAPAIPMFDLTTVVIGGHGTLEPEPNSFPAGSTVDLTAWPETDYLVEYWLGTDNDASTATTNSVIMDADKTVYVKFRPDK